jgi:hypothetical protein
MLKNSLPALVILAALGLLSGCGGGSTAKITTPGGGGGGSPQTPFLAGIEVTPEAPNLAAGTPQQFVALGIMSDGTTTDLTKSATWKASSGVVSVNGTGLVTASNSYGVTTVTAASGGVTGYTSVTVGSYVPPTPTIYVDPVNGSDSNPGTSLSAALKTIAAAQTKGRGSIVGLASGTYYLQSQTNAANAGTLQFTSADTGTTYEAYPPGSTPVVSGGYVVSGWTAAPSNPGVYVASLSAANFPQCNGQNCNFEGLFYQKAGAADSQRRSRPRTTPNTECASTSCGSYLYNNNTGSTVTFSSFSYSGTDVASSYHALGISDIEILDFEKWTMSRLRLASASGGTAALTSSTYLDTSAANNPGQATAGFLPGHRYLIENCDPGLGTVSGTPIPADAGCTFGPGQWYLDKCPTQITCSTPDPTWNLYYYPESGETPATDTVIVPQLTQLILGNGVSNLTFYGITFAHDNWYPGNTAAPINNENNSFSCTAGLVCGLGDQQGSPNVTAAVSMTDTSNVVFDQCTFSHTEGWGVEFVTDAASTSSGNQVVNSALYDIGTGAIRLGRWPNWVGTDSDTNVTQNNLVENNLISGIGRVQPSGIGTGVYVGDSHNNVIAYNNISDVYSGAIGVGVTYGRSKSSGYAHDNVIANNLVYDLGQGVTSDMGGIYFASSGATANPGNANGVPVSGNLITGNVIHDVLHDYLTPDGYGGNGLYFDQGTTTVVAHNNLVYKTSGYQLFNNLSDRTNDSFAQDNVIENNVFAYAGQYVIQRGGQNPYSFAFVSNIVYFDPTTTAGGGGSNMTVGLQGGSWPCVATAISSTTIPCNQLFFFDYNDYWITDGSAPQFVTTSPNSSVESGTGLNTYNLTQWQAQGEDMHSINQNPMFSTTPSPTNPSPSDFVLGSGSPALTLGFCGASGEANCPSYYNPTAAGLLAPTSAQSAVPVSVPAFPTEISPTY